MDSEIGSLIVILLFFLFIAFIFFKWLYFRKKGINVFGTDTIDSKLYHLGKVCSFITWAAMVVQASGFDLRWLVPPPSA